MSLRAAEKVFEQRQRIADFFDTEVEQVVFTSNCSHGLNLVIHGVMQNGGHVVTSNLEHNSVLRPIADLVERGVATSTVVDVCSKSDDVILSGFARAIQPGTKLVVCTHGSNTTGQILPIERLAQLCRRRGVFFVVDAAQTAGVLPIRLREMQIDAVCTAGHKSLYGPSGTGLLLLGSDKIFPTVFQGGTGSISLSLRQPEFYPDRLESGTINTAGICGLGAGVAFVQQRGVSDIYQHEMRLCRRAYDALSNMPQVILYHNGYELGSQLPVLLFNVQSMPSTELVDQLDQKGFALRGGLHCAPLAHRALHTERSGAARLSVSAFNQMAEIERFIRVMKNIQ